MTKNSSFSLEDFCFARALMDKPKSKKNVRRRGKYFSLNAHKTHNKRKKLSKYSSTVDNSRTDNNNNIKECETIIP